MGLDPFKDGSKRETMKFKKSIIPVRRFGMADLEKKILDVLKKEGKPIRPGDIAAKAKLDKDEVTKTINKLKKEGKVASPKRCFYAPIDG